MLPISLSRRVNCLLFYVTKGFKTMVSVEGNSKNVLILIQWYKIIHDGLLHH